MKAALYTRVSTEDQAVNGVSLKAQEGHLRHYCMARDWEVVGTYRDEGASGKSVDRPALQRLLGDAKARKFDALCVYKLDRLTRSVRDLGALLEALEKRKVALVSMTESLDASTAAGRLMVNLLGSVAQWEREVIGERTATALQYRRSQLQVYGPTPYGFRRDGDRLVPLERDLKVVKRIHAMRRRGRAMAAIADALNRDRIATKTGKRWAPATVSYVLRNDLYSPYLRGGKPSAAGSGKKVPSFTIPADQVSFAQMRKRLGHPT